MRQILSVYLESSLENVVDNVDKKLKMLIDNKCESNDDAMKPLFIEILIEPKLILPAKVPILTGLAKLPAASLNCAV